MGVNIYLKSFEKNDKTFISHIKSLNIYDGNDDEIDNYKIEEQVISNLEIIEIIISNNLFKNFYDINIYLTLNELAFYNFAYSPISGFGKCDNAIVCFEPKMLLVVIQKLILICENWNDCTDIKIDVDNNLDNLHRFRNFIDNNSKENTLIIITTG